MFNRFRKDTLALAQRDAAKALDIFNRAKAALESANTRLDQTLAHADAAIVHHTTRYSTARKAQEANTAVIGKLADLVGT